VTADAKTKTYGDGDPALTYQISSGSLAAGDAFSGSLTRAAGENVGAYAIPEGHAIAQLELHSDVRGSEPDDHAKSHYGDGGRTVESLREHRSGADMADHHVGCSRAIRSRAGLTRVSGKTLACTSSCRVLSGTRTTADVRACQPDDYHQVPSRWRRIRRRRSTAIRIPPSLITITSGLAGIQRQVLPVR